MVYNPWKKNLDASIELVPLELAGRGRRFSDSFYASFENAVEDLYAAMIKSNLECDYALWGHSMGSLLAFELAAKAMRNGQRRPVHLFFSGRYPPHVKSREKPIHNLPDEEFKNEIFKIGGTPRGFLENEELLELFLPVLRSDYRILDGYKASENVKFDCDISVFSGKQDGDMQPGDLEAWRNYTNKSCRIFEFDGGHFFINENESRIIDVINSTLAV